MVDNVDNEPPSLSTNNESELLWGTEQYVSKEDDLVIAEA